MYFEDIFPRKVQIKYSDVKSPTILCPSGIGAHQLRLGTLSTSTEDPGYVDQCRHRNRLVLIGFFSLSTTGRETRPTSYTTTVTDKSSLIGPTTQGPQCLFKTPDHDCPQTSCFLLFEYIPGKISYSQTIFPYNPLSTTSSKNVNSVTEIIVGC